MLTELMMIYESWPFSTGLVESNVMNGHGGERERRVRLEVSHVLGAHWTPPQMSRSSAMRLGHGDEPLTPQQAASRAQRHLPHVDAAT